MALQPQDPLQRWESVSGDEQGVLEMADKSTELNCLAGGSSGAVLVSQTLLLGAGFYRKKSLERPQEMQEALDQKLRHEALFQAPCFPALSGQL